MMESTRIFLDTDGTDGKEVSEELIQLLRYFEKTTEENAAGSHSQKIEKLQKRVEEIKTNEEVGIRYMNAFEEKMWERRDARNDRRETRQENWRRTRSKRRLGAGRETDTAGNRS